MKSQLLIDRHSGRSLAPAGAPGRCHDRRLYRAAGRRLPAEVDVLVDVGYQGLQHEPARTVLPFQAPPKRPLVAAARVVKRLHARLRSMVEHVIRRLQVFWILARPYRKRRRRLGRRLSLIAGIGNFELGRG